MTLDSSPEISPTKASGRKPEPRASERRRMFTGPFSHVEDLGIMEVWSREAELPKRYALYEQLMPDPRRHRKDISGRYAYLKRQKLTAEKIWEDIERGVNNKPPWEEEENKFLLDTFKDPTKKDPLKEFNSKVSKDRKRGPGAIVGQRWFLKGRQLKIKLAEILYSDASLTSNPASLHTPTQNAYLKPTGANDASPIRFRNSDASIDAAKNNDDPKGLSRGKQRVSSTTGASDVERLSLESTQAIEPPKSAEARQRSKTRTANRPWSCVEDLCIMKIWDLETSKRKRYAAYGNLFPNVPRTNGKLEARYLQLIKDGDTSGKIRERIEGGVSGTSVVGRGELLATGDIR